MARRKYSDEYKQEAMTNLPACHFVAASSGVQKKNCDSHPVSLIASGVSMKRTAQLTLICSSRTFGATRNNDMNPVCGQCNVGPADGEKKQQVLQHLSNHTSESRDNISAFIFN